MSNDSEDIRDAFNEDRKRKGKHKSTGKALSSKDLAKDKIKRGGVMDALDRCLDKRLEKNPDYDPLVGMWDRILDHLETGEGPPDIRFVQFIADRKDGKVVTPIQLTGIQDIPDEHLAAIRETLTRSKG